jgi:hypothetical protein
MKGTTSKSLLKVKKNVSIGKKRNQNATIEQKEQAQGAASLEGKITSRTHFWLSLRPNWTRIVEA